MENSLYQGDRVIVNKWSYGFRTPLTSLFSYHRLADKPVHKGDIVLFNNPLPAQRSQTGSKEVFISRCIGLPGDTLMLDSELALTAQTIFSPDSKQLYSYPPEKEDTLAKVIKQLNVEDNELIGYNDKGFIRSLSHYEIYLLKQALGDEIKFKPVQPENNDDSHPFVVPRKGKAVRVYPWNVKLLRNTIVCHEGKSAEVKKDTLIVEGKRVYSYIFTKDYYWMVSNNSVNLSDSRLFGFVPKDHLIGKASLIWFSKDSETGLFEGFRWNRFFQSVK